MPYQIQTLGPSSDGENVLDENETPIAVDKTRLDKKQILTKGECAICLEEFKLDQRVSCSQTMACDHVYHEQCLSTWLMKNDCCPCCRVILIDSKTILESGPADDIVVEGTEDSVAVFDQDQNLNTSHRGNEESTLTPIHSTEAFTLSSGSSRAEENDVELALENVSNDMSSNNHDGNKKKNSCNYSELNNEEEHII